jgi:hypothetical protein
VTCHPLLIIGTDHVCRSFKRYGAVMSPTSKPLGSFFRSLTRSICGLALNLGLSSSNTCDLGTNSAMKTTFWTGIQSMILAPNGRGSEHPPKTTTCLCRAGPTSWMSPPGSKCRPERRSLSHELSRSIRSISCAREKPELWRTPIQMSHAGPA